MILTGCSSSSDTQDREETYKDEQEGESETVSSESNAILYAAISEQGNEMYSPAVDSTYLYWVDSSLIILNGSTKCNIFALNVLYVSGFMTPSENALSIDLFDTANFSDILPVVEINKASNANAGDLIVWPYHVIIFEKLLEVNGELYAKGYWAGTRREDNGINIRNNVCYGKYKLDGDFVVRRPVKK